MKTDDLVTMLASGSVAVDNVAARRYGTAIVLGTLCAVLLMVLLLGVRGDLEAALDMPKFWIKFGFVASLAAIGLVLLVRLMRPGLRLGLAPAGLAVPVLIIWILATYSLMNAEPAQRIGLILGDTWAVCPFLIAMLSAPVFVTLLWAANGLAPTRLRLAGAAVGLVAGSVGALVYCIHCPEMEAPFLGIWYLLGISIPAILGGLSGRRLLWW